MTIIPWNLAIDQDYYFAYKYGNEKSQFWHNFFTFNVKDNITKLKIYQYSD